MAQGTGGRGSGPAGKKSGGQAARKPGVQPSGRPPGKAGTSASRTSVAAARSSRSNNRTQLIIGGVAIVLIAAVVVIGIVMNRANTAVQADGYGSSTNSSATVSGSALTISSTTPPPAGTTPVTIDLYADALCPNCGQFERQYGQQISQAVDQGKLTVNLHMLNFLDKGSFSQDYSSRAAGALLCVAQNQGSTPGLVLSYYTALFADGTQPQEQGTTDLTNAQLADLAKGLGADDATTSCIGSGASVAAAQANATTSSNTLTGVIGGVATPSVIHDGQAVNINSTSWLSSLIGS